MDYTTTYPPRPNPSFWTSLFAAGILLTGLAGCEKTPAGENWAYYLGSQESSQYSPLSQINRENVSQLQVAWTYQAGGASPEGRSQIQCNPLVIDGVLYGSGPNLRFFALNAATGEELWSFDPPTGDNQFASLGVNRGLMHWERHGQSRIFCTAGDRLFALDAATGTLIPSFGDGGWANLWEGLGEQAADQVVLSNTPGVVYKDLIILGTRVSENHGAAPGHIRAFDAVSGDLVWIFHTIPQPGEPGHETWPADAYKYVGGANSWSGMSLDKERGMVFIPTGSASFDFYGGDRHGANLYANSVLALDANTGERIWHFQTVHHDIWDRDLPAPPNLVTVTHKGKPIDAVAQITKAGFVFLLDRETGAPLFPVEEIPVPASDLKGESAWPTQPVPTLPPPFARQYFPEEALNDLHESTYPDLLARYRQTRTGQRFIPPSEEGTIIFPGFDGGGEWGGAAHDPHSGIMYVNANEMPWILTMFELPEGDNGTPMGMGRRVYASACVGCHGIDRKGGSFMGEIPSLVGIGDRLPEAAIRQTVAGGKGLMPAFAWLKEEEIQAVAHFLAHATAEMEVLTADESHSADDGFTRYAHTGYNRFVDSLGYPAIRPPWGTLNAIDLNQGEILWQVPLGSYAELDEKGIPPTGTENYGGPVLTGSGLLFIGASKDGKFRAFDSRDGSVLWETSLPAGGYATPSTYTVDGKQFVVIACGGGKMGTASGDTYVAFALP